MYVMFMGYVELSFNHKHLTIKICLMWLVHVNVWQKLPQYCKVCYAKSLQSCPTLCDPTDSSPTGSPVPGILQARTLEWVAISFSSA